MNKAKIINPVPKESLKAREQGKPYRYKAASAGSPQLAQLVAGQYINRAIRLTDGAHSYFDYTLKFSPGAPVAWSLQRATYANYVAYWIFRTDAQMSWQAQDGNGKLQYWNVDGQATWPPQDWEMFLFDFAPGSSDQVVIKSIYNNPTTGYMMQAGIEYRFSGTPANSIRFTVEF